MVSITLFINKMWIVFLSKHYELIGTGEADAILLAGMESAGEDVLVVPDVDDTLLLCSRLAFVELKFSIYI